MTGSEMGNEMSQACAVEQDLNRYMRQLDRDARINADIERQADEMSKDGAEFDPAQADNLEESMMEAPQSFWNAVSSAFSAGDLADAGRLILSESKRYNGRRAMNKAECIVLDTPRDD